MKVELVYVHYDESNTPTPRHIAYITDYDSIIKSYYKANKIDLLNKDINHFHIKIDTYPISNISLYVFSNVKDFKKYLDSCDYAMEIIKNPALKIFNNKEVILNILTKKDFKDYSFVLVEDHRIDWLTLLKTKFDESNVESTLDIDLI